MSRLTAGLTSPNYGMNRLVGKSIKSLSSRRYSIPQHSPTSLRELQSTRKTEVAPEKSKSAPSVGLGFELANKPLSSAKVSSQIASDDLFKKLNLPGTYQIQYFLKEKRVLNLKNPGFSDRKKEISTRNLLPSLNIDYSQAQRKRIGSCIASIQRVIRKENQRGCDNSEKVAEAMIQAFNIKKETLSLIDLYINSLKSSFPFIEWRNVKEIIVTLLKDPITDKKDSMDQNTPRLISSEKIIELSKNTTIFRDLDPTTWKFQSETFTSDKRKRVVNLKSLKWIPPDFKRLNKVTKEATDPRGKSDFLSATYIPNQLASEAMFPSVRGTGGNGPKERDKETKSFYSDRKTIPLEGTFNGREYEIAGSNVPNFPGHCFVIPKEFDMNEAIQSEEEDLGLIVTNRLYDQPKSLRSSFPSEKAREAEDTIHRFDRPNLVEGFTKKVKEKLGKDYKYVQDRTQKDTEAQKRKLAPTNDLRIDIPFKMLDKFEPGICIGQNGAFGSSSAPFHQHFQIFLKKFLPVCNPDICSNPININEDKGIQISKVYFPGNPYKISFQNKGLDFDNLQNKFEGILKDFNELGYNVDFLCQQVGKGKDQRLEVFLFIKKDEISQNSEGRKLWEYIGIYPSLGIVGSIGTDDKYTEYERAMDSRAPGEAIKLKISDILKNAWECK